MEVGKPWRVCLIQEENLAFFVYPKYTPNIRTGEKAAKIQLPLVCVYIYTNIIYTHSIYIHLYLQFVQNKDTVKHGSSDNYMHGQEVSPLPGTWSDPKHPKNLIRADS